MPRYTVNEAAFEHAKNLIERRQYILRSDWGERQPKAVDPASPDPARRRSA